MTGNDAAATAVKLARVQVIAAYPITPQSPVVEQLSAWVESGELPAEFVPVESEHSALTVCIGAGESVRAKIFWAGEPGIWFHTRTVAGDRYGNAFGLGRPAEGGAVSSTIEINVPTGSLDRKIGGAFAQDDAGRVFLIHRGKIGGRRGVGKSLFEAHYRGVWSEVEDGDSCSAVGLSGEVQSPRFCRQLLVARQADGAARPAGDFFVNRLAFGQRFRAGRQQVQPLAGGELARLVLLGDALGSTAELGLPLPGVCAEWCDRARARARRRRCRSRLVRPEEI